jgi:hypothetical protein
VESPFFQKFGNQASRLFFSNFTVSAGGISEKVKKGFPLNEVFLYQIFDRLFVQASIPGPFRINDHVGAISALAEAKAKRNANLFA